MTDELAPFFETRETRTGRLPEEARGKFELAEKQAVANGQTDFADRQFVSLWLSRRTGMPRRDVVANFDAIASRYFGDGTTAAAAWDRIAANYKPAGEGEAGATPGQSSEGEEFANVDGLPKVGAAALLENVDQSGRAVAGGFTGFAQKVPAGLYSQAAAMTGVRLKDPMEDAEFRELRTQTNRLEGVIYGEDVFHFDTIRKPGLLGFSRRTDKEVALLYGKDSSQEAVLVETKKNRARMDEIRSRIDAENREAVKKWRDSTKGEVSDEYRRLASFWYDLSEGAPERMGVTPEFKSTTLGQFMESAGSVPATAALAVMGPGGWVSMESAFFADVESERMGVQGTSYDPVKALPANIASTMPQLFLERAFGVERLMNKVLGEMPKLAGRVTFGDFAKQFVRRGLEAGVEEGLTEPTQNFWNDFIASQTYDEKRELFTPEAAKKRLVESVTAFTLGFVFGGGVTSVEAVDQNRAVKAGAQYLTTKDGQPMTPEDFRVLRQVKSDAELAATAPDEEAGRILIAAANGDASAQANYNNRVLNTLFVNTEDVDVNGMSLGTVQGVPVVRQADGTILPIDMTDPEDRAFVDNFKREAVRQVALTETADFLKKGLEEGRKIEVSNQERTLRDFITEAKIDVDEAAKRIGIASDVNGANIPEGAKPEDVRVLGANVAEYQAGVYRDVSHVFQGGNALTAVEEVAEGYIKKRLAVGDVFEDELKTWRDKYEADTGTKTATTGSVSNIEWFSKRVVDYAVANRKTEGMPKSWSGFFRTLGEHLKSVFRLSERLKKLKRDGKLGEDFENALKGALGMVNPDQAFAGLREKDAARMAQGNREAAPALSELDQEMMAEAQASDTYPKITGNVDDGFVVTAPDGAEIGSAQTLEDAQAKAVQWFYDQARAEERGQAVADAGLADASNELMNVIRQRGGLLAPSQEPVFGGELRGLAENMTTGQKLRLFRKNGLSLDALRESLQEDGFEFQTVTDLIDAIDKSTRGAPVFPTFGGENTQVTFSTSRAKPEDASNQVRLPDGATLVGPTTFSLTAFHGTPHKVDKFKVANVGTGEGHQVYGWGLYFAENKAVANSYQTGLTERDFIKKVREVYGEGDDPTEAAAALKEAGLSEAQSRLVEELGKEDWLGFDYPHQAVQAILRTPENYDLTDGIRSALAEFGNLYTVEILSEAEDMLDWDASLAKQPDGVRKKFEAVLEGDGWGAFLKAVRAFDAGDAKAMKAAGYSLFDYVGSVGSIYNTVGAEVGQKKLSAMLARAGIPGIRYLDQGSRNVGTGTRNFVVFDEKLVRILEENGRPVPDAKGNVTFSLAPTESDAFRDWFKDSKIVDKDGNPLVVYHGTPAMTDKGFTFDYSKIGENGRAEGAGFYFTTNRKIAQGYAEGGTVISAYLNIQKPMAYDHPGFSKAVLKKLVKRVALIEAKRDGSEIADGFLSNYGDVRYEGEASVVNAAVDLLAGDATALDQISGIVGSGVPPEIVNAAVRDVTGFDGVVSKGFSNLGTENETIYVAFFPNQVKSTENKGTFSPSNDDITFATSGIPQNNAQALAMQAAKLKAKKAAATATLIARIQAGTPLPARAKLVRRSTQASILAKLAMPVSARLQRINPQLAQRLRRFEFDLGNAISRDFQAVTPFIQGFEAMKDTDARVLDLALKNGDAPTRDAILAQYGLQAEFVTVVQVIESARQRGIAAGYEVGKIEDYFPRKVNDLDGLMTHYYGKPQGGTIEQALVEAEKKAQAQGRTLSHEERIEVVNQVLQGMRRTGSKPSNFKERRTDVVDPDADRFYADSIHALASYIESVNQAVEKRRFFGKFAVTMQAANGGTFTSNRLALEASVGAYVEDMIARGVMPRSAQTEVQGILEGRFTQGVTSQFIKNFKALSYLGTMGQITSAITQVTDLAFSLYENGVFDTVVAAGEAVTRKSKITREQLGLDNMAEEFRDVGKLHQILNLTFKAVGIHYMDLIGKETLVNGKFRQLQRQAQAGQLSARNEGIIRSSFGPAQSQQVLADLAAGKKTPDTLFAVYTVLADFQPISLSEYPEAYLRHPNGRVFYMLKTFTLKQIEAFRRESFSLIAKGSAKQKVIGFRNLVHLSGLLFLAGVPLDWLKDWIMQRDPQLQDIAVDNVFKLLGVNRWNLWQFRYRKNPLEAAMLLIVPPAPFIQYPLLDAENVAGKIAEGDDIEPGNFESWRMLPFIGAPIYWWAGGGEQKIEDRRKQRDARGRVGDR